MLNLNQLRIFYHAAKRLSFTAAARDLFITQPAVTVQIKSLEESCNLHLFKKRGKRVYLTDEGQTLFEYAKKIFDCEREIENVLGELKELKRGVLRLGTTKTYARYFMPFMLTSFHQRYPKIKILLNEGSSLEMTNSLLDFTNEVAIIAKAEAHSAIHFIPFSQEELLAVAAPGHPLTRGKAVDLQDLAKAPIIMKETGSGTRKIVNALFAEKGLVPNVLMETSNAEFIKQLIQRGEGISFLVKEAVSAELREGKLAAVPLGGPKLFLDVSIAYLKDQPLSPPAQSFLGILRRLNPVDKPSLGIGAIMAKILARRT